MNADAADIFITAYAYALGDQSHSVESSAAAGLVRSDPTLIKRAGFRTHHVCRPRTTAYALACAALEPLRDAIADTDAIIYSTALPANASLRCSEWLADPERTSTAYETDPAAMSRFPGSQLQEDFDMPQAQLIGLTQQACTGMLGSLRLARALLLSEPHTKSVLCVTADRFPAGACYEQSYNLISDGAAAVVVSRSAGPLRLRGSHQLTNGALANATDEETAGSYFSHAHRAITTTLAQAGLTSAEIDWLVPQNMNRMALEILARCLDVPQEKLWLSSLPDVAHVISADNIINLQELMASGKAKSGDRILLMMAGWGVNYQCTLLEVS